MISVSRAWRHPHCVPLVSASDGPPSAHSLTVWYILHKNLISFDLLSIKYMFKYETKMLMCTRLFVVLSEFCLCNTKVTWPLRIHITQSKHSQASNNDTKLHFQAMWSQRGGERRGKHREQRDCKCGCLFIQSRSSLLRKVSVIRQGRRGGNEKRSLWGILVLLPSKKLFPQIVPHSSRRVSVVLRSSALLALHNGRDLLRGLIIATYPECTAPPWPFWKVFSHTE